MLGVPLLVDVGDTAFRCLRFMAGDPRVGAMNSVIAGPALNSGLTPVFQGATTYWRKPVSDMPTYLRDRVSAAHWRDRVRIEFRRPAQFDAIDD